MNSIEISSYTLKDINKAKDKYIIETLSEMIRKVPNIVEDDISIIYISNYYAESDEDKIEMISNLVDNIKNTYNNFDMNYIICISANVSEIEFPLSEYSMDECLAKINHTKLIPYTKIMKRERRILKQCNFKSINDFMEYDFSEPYIYNNKLGRLVRKYMDEEKERLIRQIVKRK